MAATKQTSCREFHTRKVDWVRRTVTEIPSQSTNEPLEKSIPSEEIVDERCRLKRGRPVTAKCANPACSVPFHRLERGKLFRFEGRSPSEPCRDVPDTVCSTKSGGSSVFSGCVTSAV